MQRFAISVVFLVFSLVTAHCYGGFEFEQGFEVDTAGWDVFGGSYNAIRVASGTSGIASSSGWYHGTVTTGATNWGGYNTVFPANGYSTAVDIYLDIGGGAANDTRFDFTSAINKPDGDYRRDFAFNGGFYNDDGDDGRFIFSASNNTGRLNSYPKDPGRDPFALYQSGWYTFEHTFRDDGGGILAVDLAIIDASQSVLKTWTLSDPLDIIGSTIGGNRYGSFENNKFGFLAIDNSLRTNMESNVAPEPASILLWGCLAAMALPVVWYRKTKRGRSQSSTS